MSVFNAYARYYDLLYRDKDYVGEARFVSDLIQAHGGPGRSLLELGCGTGRHAMEFARLGYEVVGVDLSEEMVRQAVERAASDPSKQARRVRFEAGDVRSVRVDRRFDTVVSLFHVMSYQTAETDLRAAFQTAAHHLLPGGLFLFDFWYGPAVLSDPPAVRVKRLEDEAIAVTRIAEPELHPQENRVVVNYQVFLRDKSSAQLSEIREAHPMRYLFLPEMEALLAEQGMTLVQSGAWCSTRPLSEESWYGYALARLGGD